MYIIEMIIHLTVIGIICQYIENIIVECESGRNN